MDGYELANYLLKRGVQCIPLDEFKTPKLKFSQTLIDDNFIEDNKYKYISSSVFGILCRGLWCIDIDKNHGDGKDGFESMLGNTYRQELDDNAKNTLIQSTASGGMHIIFKKKSDIEYSQKIGYLDGVDIKANDNNYFVMGGSVTNKGIYKANGFNPVEYDGSFEDRIFSRSGNFRQQTMDKYSVREILPNYDFSHLRGNRKGGLGKQAYQRIIDGTSEFRNNDLYLAVGYAKACSVDIEPLKVLIGSTKGRDEFTEEEFYRTVESAMRE